MIHTVPTDDKGVLQRPGVNGGMVMKEKPEQKPVNYVFVEDMDESINKLKKLGGKIVTSKQQVLNVGWITTATDPEGNDIAFIQPTCM